MIKWSVQKVELIDLNIYTANKLQNMSHKLTELKGETDPPYSWVFQYLTF